MNENRLPKHRPVTLRDVRPPSVFDYVPPEGHANIKAAQTTAAMRRLNRQMNGVVERLADLREAEEERHRERCRRGR